MEPKPGLTVQTMVVTGLAIALVTWGAIIMWPQLRNDVMPWWRDPVRVALAIGWVDRLPESPGATGCKPPTPEAAAGRLSSRPDGMFEAVARGQVAVPCDSGSLLLDIQRVAKLSLAAPPSMKKGETISVRLMAYDVKGVQLRLGALSKVAWRADGPLRFVEAASPLGDTVKVVADGAGEGTVEATFDTLVGRTKVKSE